ncbi:CocE/NonD family hydrolase [Propylenella binzhouense]|uniref:CocE/NonD family hydrolase n=1 Tax=Propylenella binzhouense TaxID=2555902 RepID=A0A964T6L3_9HYPH|nr:CocE/NonD family hydrolase [Propylenella binzhouense]MYZ49496.1 CocE/NonD family hydrolase [Propylenella binzhouense]
MPPVQEERFKVADSRVRNVYGVPKDAEIVLLKDVPAGMRDGVALMTNVFRPAAAGRYPVIVTLAPYGKDGYPADAQYGRIPFTGNIFVSEWAAWENPDPVYWVPHGYVLVVADCRGTNRSGGARFEHFSRQMGLDFHDLVEWAARQDWSDGNVGANGVSYLALTQWLGAAENPPHLKAIVPWEGFNDPYREHAFHGGIPDTGFFRSLWSRRMDPETGFVAKGASAENIVAEQAAHPLLDEFWRAKHPELGKIDVPAYVVAGWATGGLHTRGSIEGFKQIASREKWLECHGRKEWEYYYSREALERQRRFLDCFLKGEETGIRDLPRVRYEVRDRFYEGRFRFADDFPIPGTRYRALNLRTDGSLSESPAAEPGTLTYASERGAPAPNRLAFRYRFAERTELVGHAKLRLWVSAAAADDMDLHVALKKFDRHGHEVFFPDFQHYEQGVAAAGWLRASHRELDEARSTPWQPWLKHARELKLTPGEPVPVEIEIMPSGTGFDAGDELVLVVQGYDIIDYPPRFAHLETVNRGSHSVHMGGSFDSHLLVPVVPVP